MADVGREAGLTSDSDALAHRSEQTDGVRTFVALMRVVHTTERFRGGDDGNHLVSAGVTLRCVEQTRTDTVCPFAHRLRDQRAHCVDLLASGGCCGRAQHLNTRGAESRHRVDIRTESRAL